MKDSLEKEIRESQIYNIDGFYKWISDKNIKEFNRELIEEELSKPLSKDEMNFFEIYENLQTLYDKLKYLGEFVFPSEEYKQHIFNQITEKHFQEYLSVLTPEELRSTGYNITKINKKLGIITFNKEMIVEEILKNFSIGDKISKSSIKNYLERLYFDFGYEKSPKASDLDEYFEIKDIKLKDDSGKWVNGFEIIKKKY